MRVLERLGAGMSLGRPVGLGKCCVYTHLNWCLLPACFWGLPLGLMNTVLSAGSPKWEDVAPSLGLSSSTICVWVALPRSASAGHWIILLEVLRRVLGAETPAGVHSYHHHQGHYQLLETVRASELPGVQILTLLQFHPFIHPRNICQGPPMGKELCLALCGVTRQTQQSPIEWQLFPISSCPTS